MIRQHGAADPHPPARMRGFSPGGRLNATNSDPHVEATRHEGLCISGNHALLQHVRAAAVALGLMIALRPPSRPCADDRAETCRSKAARRPAEAKRNGWPKSPKLNVFSADRRRTPSAYGLGRRVISLLGATISTPPFAISISTTGSAARPGTFRRRSAAWYARALPIRRRPTRSTAGCIRAGSIPAPKRRAPRRRRAVLRTASLYRHSG